MLNLYVKLALKNFAMKCRLLFQFTYFQYYFFSVQFNQTSFVPIKLMIRSHSYCTINNLLQVTIIFLKNDAFCSQVHYNALGNFFDASYFWSKYFNYQVAYCPYFHQSNSLLKNTAKSSFLHQNFAGFKGIVLQFFLMICCCCCLLFVPLERPRPI